MEFVELVPSLFLLLPQLIFVLPYLVLYPPDKSPELHIFCLYFVRRLIVVQLKLLEAAL